MANWPCAVTNVHRDPKACCGCGAGLICGTEVGVERRQVFDRELAGVADTAL
ncbi:hypothetical protein ACQP1G_00725 [Nocardia sp. CA-107356]|uniref:hypothetical protein n=1 Tax=Nocardia sp. CA-107356 TaxID=3239972 RepID=UPI003D904D82